MCKQKTNERLWLEEWLSEYFSNESYQIKPLFVGLSHTSSDDFEVNNHSDNVLYFGRVSGSDEGILDINMFGAIGAYFNMNTYVDLNQNVLFHSFSKQGGCYIFQGYAIIFNNPLFATSGRRPEK